MANQESWQEALARHYPADALSVPFGPSVRLLQDRTFCRVIEDDLRAHASNWEVRIATPGLANQLPDSPGLYMFVWRPNSPSFVKDENKSFLFSWLLYIGKTGSDGSQNTLKNRYKQEYAAYIDSDPNCFWNEKLPDNRKSRLKTLLSLSPLEYWYSVIENTEEISKLEERLIKIFRPPGNANGRNVLRPKPAIQAFRRY
jgi:hypothetical protein